MSVKIITESGAEIELPPALVAESDPAVVEAFVEGERVKAGLSRRPPRAKSADAPKSPPPSEPEE